MAVLRVLSPEMVRMVVTDPLTTAKAVGGNPYRGVSTATAECIRYAYDGAVDGPWHVIRRDTANQRVVLKASATLSSTVTDMCDITKGTWTQLGSNQVDITALTFSPTTTSTTPPVATDESLVRQFNVTITGHLSDQDAQLNSISRTMSQTIFVRSIGTGN